MLELGQRHYLFFDGDCGICTWSATTCERIDRRKLFAVVPYQLIPEEELLNFGLDYQKCSERVQVITRSGRVHSGAFAVNYFLFLYFPWSLLVILCYAIPVFLLLEVLGYRLIARNRFRLSHWFGLKACLIKK
jgi:predicted DCC family thiol-disulfide oxidoreductase YuxK